MRFQFVSNGQNLCILTSRVLPRHCEIVRIYNEDGTEQDHVVTAVVIPATYSEDPLDPIVYTRPITRIDSITHREPGT
jgi:hypothetical protein